MQICDEEDVDSENDVAAHSNGGSSPEKVESILTYFAIMVVLPPNFLPFSAITLIFSVNRT